MSLFYLLLYEHLFLTFLTAFSCGSRAFRTLYFRFLSFHGPFGNHALKTNFHNNSYSKIIIKFTKTELACFYDAQIKVLVNNKVN